MEYPYTLIYNKDDLYRMDTILKNLNYKVGYGSLLDYTYVSHLRPIVVVLNDCDNFGVFCFYELEQIDRSIDRYLISNIDKFLFEAIKYKNVPEF